MNRRRMLAGAACLIAFPAAAGARRAAASDAAVAAPGGRAPAGVPVFRSLAAALASAPANPSRPFRIWLGRGIWQEKLTIERPSVHIVGEDRRASILRFTAASGQIAPDGKPWGTFRTPTLTVRAPGFRASNLTIENGFDGIAEMRKKGPKLGSHDPLGPQAVALMLTGESDRALFDRVDIHSHQDTLFPDAGISLFRDCLVTGSYDFIFGAGTALFERCEIRSRLRPDPVEGYITAPSTFVGNRYGLIFDRCRLTRDAGVARSSVFLGRPWRPSKAFADGRYGDPDRVGMAAFLRCWMDDHIAPAGWTEMWYTDRSGNPRTMLQPEQARFYEYRNSGPGAGKHPRGRQLTAAEAAFYSADKVLDAWRPA